MATENPTKSDVLGKDKMILLDQLERYDQKIKENTSSNFLSSVEVLGNIGTFTVSTGKNGKKYLYISLSTTDDQNPALITASNKKIGYSQEAFIQLCALSTLTASVDNTGILTFMAESEGPQETGFRIPKNGGLKAEIDDEMKLCLSVNVGKGVKLDSATGALEANVDGITIGINGNTGMMSVRPTESITVTNQLSSGSVTAQYNPGSVCIHFNDAFVSGFTKTKVGQLATTYAPSVKVTGSVAGIGGSGYLLTAFCQVDTDGSIYINPVRSSGTDIAWTGTLTYLI